MTLTATKIDSSHESGKNLITWAWPRQLTTGQVGNPPIGLADSNPMLNVPQSDRLTLC
jgi:hypothetical protein